MNNSSIQALQAQLASLQVPPAPTQHTAISSAPFMAPTGLSQPIPDIETIVKTIIERELSEMKRLIQELQPKAVVKELTILDAIGLGLTESEQLWLSSTDVIKQVPTFLSLPEGMELTKLFISTFKDFYENTSPH
jgi:hypothetical protein